MAISPEVKPRIVIPTPRNYDPNSRLSSTAKSRQDQYEHTDPDTNSWIPYAVGIIGVIVLGYFAYPYFAETTSSPSINKQNLTVLAPPPAPVAPVQ
jgi:hypothetical protein